MANFLEVISIFAALTSLVQIEGLNCTKLSYANENLVHLQFITGDIFQDLSLFIEESLRKLLAGSLAQFVSLLNHLQEIIGCKILRKYLNQK